MSATSPKRSSAPGYLSAKSDRRRLIGGAAWRLFRSRRQDGRFPSTAAVGASKWAPRPSSKIIRNPSPIPDRRSPPVTRTPGKVSRPEETTNPAPTRVAMNRCPLDNPSSSQCRLYGRTRRPVLGVAWTAGPPAPRLAAQPPGGRLPSASSHPRHMSSCLRLPARVAPFTLTSEVTAGSGLATAHVGRWGVPYA